MVDRNVVTLSNVLQDIAEDPVILSDDDDRSQLSNAAATHNSESQDILANADNDDETLDQRQSEPEDGELREPQAKRVSFAPSVETTTTGNTCFRLDIEIYNNKNNQKINY